MDEKDCVRALREGNLSALEALMDRYSAYVYTVAASILRSSMTEEDIEEVVSDVFFALWKHRKALRAPDRVKSWLGRTARNMAVNKLRQKRPVLELEDDLLSPEEETMDDHLSRQERQHRVEQALREMESRDREIFLRHYYCCQSVREIAPAVGLSVSAVKTRLFRGRSKLREWLLKGGWTDETDL
ncbi:MAG: sigma-70 family RNA polymerase sigma factor [Oscillospiraceae bacterium]|nr:sigma-70 family RNA polymerase sigma factor [Oscillospiraceae bacterium]